MFYETQKPHDDAPFAAGPPTGFADVFATAVRQAWYVDNPLSARATAMEEAYDRRIDAIFAATGQRGVNPERMLPQPVGGKREPSLYPRIGRRTTNAQTDPHAEFDAWLADMATKHPEHAGVISAERSPREDAHALARQSDQAAHDTFERYDGPRGTGTVASFAGSFAGGLADPAHLLSMAIGPLGRVGVGPAAIAWQGLKVGAANAASEAAKQPLVAAWRQEAGLEYDVSHFLHNVGGAAVGGALIDAGGRSLFRGVQRSRGLVPRLDAGGKVEGWHTPADALEHAAFNSRLDTLRTAAAGDVEGMRALAGELGLAEHPEVKAMLDLHDLERATSPRHPSLDPGDADARFAQAVRAVLDEREPEPVSSSAPRAAERVREAEPPQLAATRTPLETAIALRADPDLAGRVSLDSDHMQVAHALSLLSDHAFERVATGAADPRFAALVGQHVADETRHAGILAALDHAQPESLASARHMIAELLPPETAPRMRMLGLDDPSGPQAKAEADALEVQLADRIAAAQARRGDDVTVLDQALTSGLEHTDRLERMAELIENCKV